MVPQMIIWARTLRRNPMAVNGSRRVVISAETLYSRLS